MKGTTGINLGRSLILIHRVITRGLEVAAHRSKEYADAGFPEGATKAGFAVYVRSLATVIHVHQLSEDELLFPYFRSLRPEAPFSTLAFDHKALAAMLPQMEAAAGALENGGRAGQALLDLHRVVTRVHELWRPHIAVEEQHFSPAALARWLGPAEDARLLEECSDYYHRLAGPDYLIFPFLLHNLAPTDRAVYAEEFPPTVSRRLVPLEWKDHWAPMAPFLLP